VGQSLILGDVTLMLMKILLVFNLMNLEGRTDNPLAYFLG